MIRTIGSSQYFFLMRMNRQSCPINSMSRLRSELVFQGLGSWAGRGAEDPITGGVAVEPEFQWILSEATHQQPDRGDNQEEHDAEDHRTHDSVKEQSQL